MKAIAKVTAKDQTTIQRREHKAPQLERVASPSGEHRNDPPEYLRALEGTLGEWLSEADEEAYRKL